MQLISFNTNNLAGTVLALRAKHSELHADSNFRCRNILNALKTIEVFGDSSRNSNVFSFLGKLEVLLTDRFSFPIVKRNFSFVGIIHLLEGVKGSYDETTATEGGSV